MVERMEKNPTLVQFAMELQGQSRNLDEDCGNDF